MGHMGPGTWPPGGTPRYRRNLPDTVANGIRKLLPIALLGAIARGFNPTELKLKLYLGRRETSAKLIKSFLRGEVDRCLRAGRDCLKIAISENKPSGLGSTKS